MENTYYILQCNKKQSNDTLEFFMYKNGEKPILYIKIIVKQMKNTKKSHKIRVVYKTPKRQATGSNPAGGAKNGRCKPLLMVYSGFLLSFSERSCLSAGTILYIFRCMPANWLRTVFPALLIKNAGLLIRFSRPIFRMGPTPAMREGQPVHRHSGQHQGPAERGIPVVGDQTGDRRRAVSHRTRHRQL